LCCWCGKEEEKTPKPAKGHGPLSIGVPADLTECQVRGRQDRANRWAAPGRNWDDDDDEPDDNDDA